MIQTETFYIGNKEFIRTYSSSGMMIHGGFPEANYDEATDPVELGRTYAETDIPIGTDIESEEHDKAVAYDILTGVSE